MNNYIHPSTNLIRDYGSLSRDSSHISLAKDGTEIIMGTDYLVHIDNLPSYDAFTETLSIDGVQLEGGFYQQQYSILTIPLSMHKHNRKVAIKNEYIKQLAAGHTCTNAMDMDISTLLKDGLDLATSLNETEMLVRDFDNISHTLPIADVLTLTQEIALAKRDLWLNKVAKQDLIEGKTSYAEIQSVSW